MRWPSKYNIRCSHKIKGHIEDCIMSKTIVLKADNLDHIPYTPLGII
jgi:hypothetical protein